MRTDLRETSEGTGIAGSRRGRSAMSRLAANENSVGLEPLAVDALLGWLTTRGEGANERGRVGHGTAGRRSGYALRRAWCTQSAPRAATVASDALEAPTPRAAATGACAGSSTRSRQAALKTPAAQQDGDAAPS